MNNYSEQGTESLKIRETFRSSSIINEKKYTFFDTAMSWYGNMSPLTKDSTRMKYLNELNSWQLPFFADMDIREICAFQWKDISFEEQTISVNKTMQRLRTKDAGSRKRRKSSSPTRKASIQ